MQYKLYQNQELTKEQYAAGISAFQVFLKEHPESTFATEISNRITAWQAEVSNVESGRVKFANKWMTSEEKAPLYSEWQKNQQIQSVQGAAGSLQDKLANLQQQRKKAAENLTAAQGNLAEAQSKLANLQDTQVPIYREVIDRHPAHYDDRGRFTTGGVDTIRKVPTGYYQTVPNPDRPQQANRVASFQSDVTQSQALLASLDASIQDVQAKLQNAQQAQQLALSQISQTPAQVQPQTAQVQTQIVIQQVAAPLPDTPKTEPEEPWLNRNWKWIGGCVLVGLAYFAFSRR